MTRWRSVVVAALVGFASTAPVFAQGTAEPKVAVTIGVGSRVTPTTFSQSTTFEAFAEEGSIKTDYAPKKVPWTDVGVVVRLWRGLGVGVAGSFLRGSNLAQVSGLIPHPLIANQPRPISGTAAVFHSESAIHLQAVYWMQPTPRVDVVLSGGPSTTRIEQDFVSDVTYTQVFPYDVATYQSATLVRERKTVVGGNLAAAVDWRMLRRVGVGAVVRYSSATADFADTGVPAFKVGGLHVAGGISLLF